jgi:hypothetical protein
LYFSELYVFLDQKEQQEGCYRKWRKVYKKEQMLPYCQKQDGLPEKHTAAHAAISGPSDKHAGHQREWQLYNTEEEMSRKVLKRQSRFYNGSMYDVACKTPRQKTAEQIAVFWALHSF